MAFPCAIGLRTAGCAGAGRLPMRFIVIVAPSRHRRSATPTNSTFLRQPRSDLGRPPTSRIVQTTSFAGGRAFALVVEADTGRDLDDRTVFAPPAERLALGVHLLLENDSSPIAASAE